MCVWRFSILIAYHAFLYRYFIYTNLKFFLTYTAKFTSRKSTQFAKFHCLAHFARSEFIALNAIYCAQLALISLHTRASKCIHTARFSLSLSRGTYTLYTHIITLSTRQHLRLCDFNGAETSKSISRKR